MISLRQCLRDIANYVKGTKDYVIEQGVQSGWRYRKWKSGVVELWRSGSVTGNAAAWNGGYGITSLVVDLPFSVTHGMALYAARAGTGFGMAGDAISWSSTLSKLSLSTWGSQNGRVVYNIYVFGHWK